MRICSLGKKQVSVVRTGVFIERVKSFPKLILVIAESKFSSIADNIFRVQETITIILNAVQKHSDEEYRKAYQNFPD